MRVRTIWFKLNVLYLAALAISLTFYSGFLYFGQYHSLHRELDRQLQAKAYQINNILSSYLNILGRDPRSFTFSAQHIVMHEGSHSHANKIERFAQLWSKQERALVLKDDYVNIVNSKGESIARSGPFPAVTYPSFTRDIRAALKGSRPVTRDVKMGKQRLRVINMALPYDLKEPHVLQVGMSLNRLDEALHQKKIFIMFSILIILTSASLLNHFFSARILKPVLEIATTARNINYKDLSKKIATQYPDEEMQDLVDSFNDMVSRLDRSFKYISQFSSHVSHELKTPLTIMKGESELALRSRQDPDEYHRVIQNNLEEIERMIKIVNDLLLLTRLDYQQEAFKFEEFELVGFFTEMQEPVNVLAQDKQISIVFHLPRGPMKIKGDAVHLRRLFFNLIHNAVKFTPSSGRIDVILKYSGRNALVSVADTGPGIPAHILPKIFDQFFHFGPTGYGQAVGTGLGLSIAQSIAKIHRGKIRVETQAGKGSTFIVELPLTPDPLF